MKKLLYIVASSKLESLSSCQRGARIFLNCFLEQHPEYVIEEINVFHEYSVRWNSCQSWNYVSL